MTAKRDKEYGSSKSTKTGKIQRVSPHEGENVLGYTKNIKAVLELSDKDQTTNSTSGDPHHYPHPSPPVKFMTSWCEMVKFFRPCPPQREQSARRQTVSYHVLPLTAPTTTEADDATRKTFVPVESFVMQ